MIDLAWWKDLAALLQPLLAPLVGAVVYYARKLVNTQEIMHERLLTIEVYIKQRDPRGYRETVEQLAANAPQARNGVFQ